MTESRTPDQNAAAIAHYETLRAELHRLGEAPEPDQAAIDKAIDALNAASAAYREATTGVKGNNPDDDY
jgi:hypothetical protein